MSYAIWHTHADAWQEVATLRYCLCCVSQVLVGEVALPMPTVVTPHLRAVLFDAFATWCEEGLPPGKPRPHSDSSKTNPHTAHIQDSFAEAS